VEQIAGMIAEERRSGERFRSRAKGQAAA